MDLPTPSEAAPNPGARSGPAAVAAAGIVVGLLALGVLLYYFLASARIVPPSYDGWIRVALVAAIGFLAVVAVGRVLFVAVARWVGTKHAGLIHSAYRLIAYVSLAVAVLYAAGINGYALLAGGTFAGLVLGLASQSALSNFVSGVILLIARPFEPGDRVTIVSSSYGFLLPSYPPKFFSQDLLMPGFTGFVEDIGLAFTNIRLDDGTVVVLPNSVVIAAAVVSHSSPDRWVRVKYEIPPALPPDRLIPRLKEVVGKNPWVVPGEAPQVLVNQATMTSYIVSVDARCRGNLEEPPRSSLLIDIIRTVRELNPPGAPAPGPPASPSSSSTTAMLTPAPPDPPGVTPL